jgi:hypothetical protein
VFAFGLRLGGLEWSMIHFLEVLAGLRFAV